MPNLVCHEAKFGTTISQKYNRLDASLNSYYLSTVGILVLGALFNHTLPIPP